ncbi:glycosyltransferase family 2 protein [Enterobacteriaceae bacterium LUAb1]
MKKKPPDTTENLLSRMRIKSTGQRHGELPFVSVVTPTWNRRAFLPYLIYMFQYQDYPAEKRELIILDDSEHDSSDLITTLTARTHWAERIRYYHQSDRMTIGEKRNMLNKLAKGEYIVCMDDDDYYPADKIRYTITEMRKYNALLAGCDQIAIWYSHIDRVYRTHAFGKHHALNGTLTYHRNYLRNHRYDDRAKLAEETGFTNHFTVPILQLKPERSILCISHNENTWDKDFILGSCEMVAEGIDRLVSDPRLRGLYQRLKYAPVNSRIDWSFFEKVVISCLSQDAVQHQAFLTSLQQQGMPDDKRVLVTTSAGAPLAESHLKAVDLAQKHGWKNYLILDDRAKFVRQEKTVNNINKLLRTSMHIDWDVLLLGSELLHAHPLQSLPGCIKPVQMSRPAACVINQHYYPRFRDMLKNTLSAQRRPDCTVREKSVLHWEVLCREDRWLALYSSWAYREYDDQGNDSAWRYFKKLNLRNTAGADAVKKQQRTLS